MAAKPKASQQFLPVAQRDAALRELDKQESKAKVHSHQTAEILAELERDKTKASGGWNDFNHGFFARLMDKGE